MPCGWCAAPEKDALARSGPLGVGGLLGRLAFWKPLFCWAAPKLGSSSASGRAGDRHMSISGTLSFPALPARCSMHSSLRVDGSGAVAWQAA